MTDHDKQLCIQLETELSNGSNDNNRDSFKSTALRYLNELECLVDDPRRFMDRLGWMTANLMDTAFNIKYCEGRIDGIEFVTGLDEV